MYFADAYKKPFGASVGLIEHRVGLWNLVTGQEEMVFNGHDKYVTALTFSPDGDTLVTASGLDGTIKCWDPLTGQERLTLRHEEQKPVYLTFTPDGETLVVSWMGGLGKSAQPAAVTLYRAPKGTKVQGPDKMPGQASAPRVAPSRNE